jgi:drug/metabolite transporter (DMT)-like permease
VNRFFSRTHLPGVLLLSLFFGTNIVFSRFSLTQFHPIGFVAVRMAIAAPLALLWHLIRQRSLPRSRALWVHGSIVGITATLVPMMLFVSALQYQSSGVTALMVSMVPLAVMFVAHVRLNDDRLSAWKTAGALTSFAGVLLLLVTGETGLGQPRWEGFALVFAGMICAAFGIVHLRKYLRNENGLAIAAVRLVSSAVVGMPVAALAGTLDFSAVEASGLVALTYSVLPGTLFGFVLYSWLVAKFGATRATQSEYVTPVIATTTGAIFLGEQVSLVMIIGMVIVFVGIWIATGRHASRAKL